MVRSLALALALCGYDLYPLCVPSMGIIGIKDTEIILRVKDPYGQG